MFKFSEYSFSLNNAAPSKDIIEAIHKSNSVIAYVHFKSVLDNREHICVYYN